MPFTLQENRDETDPELLQKYVNEAVNGLMQLDQYRSLTSNNHELEFKAISNPILHPAESPPDLMQILASSDKIAIPSFVTKEACALLEDFREKEYAKIESSESDAPAIESAEPAADDREDINNRTSWQIDLTSAEWIVLKMFYWRINAVLKNL